MTSTGVGADVAWLESETRLVRALLIEVIGSAPLPPGASMLINEHGEVEGSITGGCVEAALVGEAEAIFSGAPAHVVTYGISDDLAGSVGLMCGGTVVIFVYEIDAPARRVERKLARAVADGIASAVATLVDGDGAGRKLAVIEGEVMGSLGSPKLDANVSREASGFLDDGRSDLRRFGADGATLGSDLRVHIHAFAPPPEMIIFGAVDFAAALARVARQIGYSVTICDAREVFLRSPRFSGVANVAMGWPQDIMKERRLGPRDAVLVFTHDRKFDEPAIKAALASGVGYIGALGSRRTANDRFERLHRAGISDHELMRVHAPCGLDIGSRTPEETAVSVLAEIIAIRSARSGKPLRETQGPIHKRG
jgi:xanthine dehydrogenase accessory factor